MTKKQHYMTRDERLKLEAYKDAGMPVAEIARKLGFCRQTIYNELRVGSYQHNVDYAYETRYSAQWEKGTNENHNRMIRRWFPKGTDFSKISVREIKECEQWMNDYPRKTLDWMTPNIFAQQIAV